MNKRNTLLLYFILSIVNANALSERIVSLSPGITEILFAVGAGDKVVGVTSYCNYPEETLSKIKVGAYVAQSINMEAVVSLKPDLVLCEKTVHMSLLPFLDRLGIRTLSLTIETIDDILSCIQVIAAETGNEESARKLVSEMNTKLLAYAEKISVIHQKKRVYWEIWDTPLLCAGSESFIGEILEYAGGINIFYDSTSAWPQVNQESVIFRNPDVIISSNTRGGTLDSESILSRNTWKNINAIKTGDVYMVSEDVFSRPGPRIIDGIAVIIDILYPDN